jgi:hypothetical protein
MATGRSGATTNDVTSPSVQDLRTRAAGYPADPFLLTVTADGEPHCSPVPVEWAGERPIVPAPRHWVRRPPPWAQPGAPRPVSLLFAPEFPGGYALIVNGTTDDAGPRLAISITRAVLHRRGNPAGDGGSACGSDCVPLLPAE